MSSSSPQMKRPRADATPGQRADGSWSFFDLSPATKRQLLTSKLVDRAIRQHSQARQAIPRRADPTEAQVLPMAQVVGVMSPPLAPCAGVDLISPMYTPRLAPTASSTLPSPLPPTPTTVEKGSRTPPRAVARAVSEPKPDAPPRGTPRTARRMATKVDQATSTLTPSRHAVAVQRAIEEDESLRDWLHEYVAGIVEKKGEMTRLARAQIEAFRDGRKGSIEWKYEGESDTLVGAVVDGKFFDLAELKSFSTL